MDIDVVGSFFDFEDTSHPTNSHKNDFSSDSSTSSTITNQTSTTTSNIPTSNRSSIPNNNNGSYPPRNSSSSSSSRDNNYNNNNNNINFKNNSNNNYMTKNTSNTNTISTQPPQSPCSNVFMSGSFGYNVESNTLSYDDNDFSLDGFVQDPENYINYQNLGGPQEDIDILLNTGMGPAPIVSSSVQTPESPDSPTASIIGHDSYNKSIMPIIERAPQPHNVLQNKAQQQQQTQQTTNTVKPRGAPKGNGSSIPPKGEVAKVPKRRGRPPRKIEDNNDKDNKANNASQSSYSQNLFDNFSPMLDPAVKNGKQNKQNKKDEEPEMPIKKKRGRPKMTAEEKAKMRMLKREKKAKERAMLEKLEKNERDSKATNSISTISNSSATKRTSSSNSQGKENAHNDKSHSSKSSPSKQKPNNMPSTNTTVAQPPIAAQSQTTVVQQPLAAVQPQTNVQPPATAAVQQLTTTVVQTQVVQPPTTQTVVQPQTTVVQTVVQPPQVAKNPPQVTCISSKDKDNEKLEQRKSSPSQSSSSHQHQQQQQQQQQYRPKSDKPTDEKVFKMSTSTFERQEIISQPPQMQQSTMTSFQQPPMQQQPPLPPPPPQQQQQIYQQQPYSQIPPPQYQPIPQYQPPPQMQPMQPIYRAPPPQQPPQMIPQAPPQYSQSQQQYAPQPQQPQYVQPPQISYCIQEPLHQHQHQPPPPPPPHPQGMDINFAEVEPISINPPNSYKQPKDYPTNYNRQQEEFRQNFQQPQYGQRYGNQMYHQPQPQQMQPPIHQQRPLSESPVHSFQPPHFENISSSQQYQPQQHPQLQQQQQQIYLNQGRSTQYDDYYRRTKTSNNEQNSYELIHPNDVHEYRQHTAPMSQYYDDDDDDDESSVQIASRTASSQPTPLLLPKQRHGYMQPQDEYLKEERDDYTGVNPQEQRHFHHKHSIYIKNEKGEFVEITPDQIDNYYFQQENNNKSNNGYKQQMIQSQSQNDLIQTPKVPRQLAAPPLPKMGDITENMKVYRPQTQRQSQAPTPVEEINETYYYNNIDSQSQQQPIQRQQNAIIKEQPDVTYIGKSKTSSIASSISSLSYHPRQSNCIDLEEENQEEESDMYVNKRSMPRPIPMKASKEDSTLSTVNSMNTPNLMNTSNSLCTSNSINASNNNNATNSPATMTMNSANSQYVPPQLQFNLSEQLPQDLQAQIEAQNQLQQSIEQQVLSMQVIEPPYFQAAMQNTELVFNPFQLLFEPRPYWQEFDENLAFGFIVNTFFRHRRTRITKFMYKLYNMLVMTSKIPILKGIVGVNWVTSQIFSVNKQCIAAMLNLSAMSVDDNLFGEKGNFTIRGFYEITNENYQDAGLSSFPEIANPQVNILVFHIDHRFTNREMTLEELDELENKNDYMSAYNSKIPRSQYPMWE